LMIERIQGKRGEIKRVILSTKLIIRQTCGKILKGELLPS